jgi:hypothetical protein
MKDLTKEKVSELDVDTTPTITDCAGYTYNIQKMMSRQDELAQEFLSSYVVPNPSKEV